MNRINISNVLGMNMSYQQYSFSYFLDAQERLGISGIELWLGAPHVYLDAYTYSCGKMLRRQLMDHRVCAKVVTCPSMAYQYQYSPMDDDAMNKCYQYFMGGLHIASELGAEIMTVNSGWSCGGKGTEDAFLRSAELLYMLSEQADRNGVALALESLTPMESDLVNSLDSVVKMKKTVGHSNLKVMLDTGAIACSSEETQDWFDIFGRDIVHTHFVDGAANSIGHYPWGDGMMDLEKELYILNCNGYTGYLSQELSSTTDPFATQARNMYALRQYLG